MLDLLSSYWRANPHMRLGQIVCNMTEIGSAVFYQDDVITERKMRDALGLVAK